MPLVAGSHQKSGQWHGQISLSGCHRRTALLAHWPCGCQTRKCSTVEWTCWPLAFWDRFSSWPGTLLAQSGIELTSPRFVLSNSGVKGICLPSGNTMTLNFWPLEPWKSKFVILGNLSGSCRRWTHLMDVLKDITKSPPCYQPSLALWLSRIISTIKCLLYLA